MPVTVPWNWSAAVMVILPGVLVVMVMLEPWTRLVTPQLPEPLEAKSCPAWVGEEEVAVPPRAMASSPVQPKVKLLLAILPVTLVSLVVKPTRVVPKVLEPVPPLATARMPETSEEPKAMAPL